MSPRLRTGLALAGSFALGGGLLFLALRGADFATVGEALREAHWGWLVPLALVSVLSVVARAWRWAILLDTLPRPDGTPQPSRTPLGVATSSVLIGYLVNLAIPRLGEVVRAGNVAARRPVGFAAVVGTVVAERLLDVILMIGAIASVAVMFGDRLGALAAEAAAGLERLVAGLPAAVDALIVGGAVILVGAAVAFYVRAKRKRGSGPGRFAGLVAQFRDGLLTLVRTGRPLALVVSTLVIWGSYVVMSYLPLRILGMTGLSLVDAFVLMTVGAVGMALPAPGGAGSYHYATIQTLVLLFGVAVSPATSYAVLAHAAQLLFYAVTGAGALLWQGTGLRAVTSAAKSKAEAPIEPPPVATLRAEPLAARP